MLTKESTLDEAVGRFFYDRITVPLVNIKTVLNYRATFNGRNGIFTRKPHTKRITIGELNADVFNRFLYELGKKGMANETVWKYSVHFSALIRYLYEYESCALIERDFRYRLYAPKCDTKCKDHLTIEQLMNLFQRLRLIGQEYYDIAYIYSKVGCRRSELLWDRHANGDWKPPTFQREPPAVTIRTTLKKGKQRRIPIDIDSTKLIESICRHTNHSNEIVFGISGDNFSAVLKTQFLAMGLDKGYDIQCLRRTALSHLAMACQDLKIVKEVAGHANITTTDRYYAKYTDAKIIAGMKSVQY